jgi:hypothetical protein
MRHYCNVYQVVGSDTVLSTVFLSTASWLAGGCRGAGHAQAGGKAPPAAVLAAEPGDSGRDLTAAAPRAGCGPGCVRVSAAQYTYSLAFVSRDEFSWL